MSATWEDALPLMRRALAILDEFGAPMDIGAHLDLAIVRLEEARDAGKQDNAAPPDADQALNRGRDSER